MFGKQKKVKSSKQKEQPEIDPRLAKQIHIMPQRFYIKPKKKRSGLVIIIIVGVLVIGSLAVVAFYLNESLKNSQAVQPAPVNQNLNVNLTNQAPSPVNQNSNLNQNLNTNTGVATSTNINVNAATTTDLNVNTNTNINTNVNSNLDVSKPLPLAADSDSDGLTLAEENLYGTNPEIGDSDGDGYQDGAELLAGYDPTKPTTTLAESALFSDYNHPLYSIIYPKRWELKEQDENKDEVLFTSPGGEFIEVLVVANPESLPLNDWYKNQFPSADLKSAVAVKINNLSGLRHPNQRSYYLVKDGDISRIFILAYNVGNFIQTNFAATFQVIVKSFKLLP